MSKKPVCLAVVLVAFLVCSPGLLSTVVLLAAALVGGIVAMDYLAEIPAVRAGARRTITWLERRWEPDER